MRISDWSSDVCSSDLLVAGRRRRHQAPRLAAVEVAFVVGDGLAEDILKIVEAGKAELLRKARQRRGVHGRQVAQFRDSAHRRLLRRINQPGQDRTSVVSAKRVSARVDLGGGRTLQQTKND